MSSKWINTEAFEQYEKNKDKIPEEPEQTEEEIAEINRLNEKQINMYIKHSDAMKKGWKTRRWKAFEKAFEKFKEEGIQPVYIDGKLEKRYIIGSVNVPIADIDCKEVFG